ncbi:MAG: FliI/YscN family ATPase [Armatimonadota bacterium]|nr:FliI/YscN family ATPase [Armatimonadota bacterium]
MSGRDGGGVLRTVGERLSSASTVRRTGRVTKSVGIIIESDGPPAQVGEMCEIATSAGSIRAEVVGFRDERLLMMPLGHTRRIAAGSTVIASGRPMMIPVSKAMLGRVFDGLCRPLDDRPASAAEKFLPAEAAPPKAMHRRRITEPLPLGVRAIDGPLTCGRGQRVGIFSGSGVGKSTLLGTIARNTAADVNVIGLIGERGREVREFVEEILGEGGLARSVVVAATSDQPPLVRLRGAQVATTIAEFFRDRGLDVLLMMDSITRVAWAQREVGLAAGEPPTRNGYTPSVFAELPRLLERSGMSERGSITALYAILVEGDDMTEPVADAARGILDGHIVLSRELANQGHYPAVDVLQSVSRLMDAVVDEEHQRHARTLCENMAVYAEHEDLITLGAYEAGSDPAVDRAIALRPQILRFLRQDVRECPSFADTRRALAEAIQPPPEPAPAGPDLGGEPQHPRRPHPSQALASFRAAAGAQAADESQAPAENRPER